MTTSIKIDAHAGWDVEVKIAQLTQEGNLFAELVVVIPKNTEQTLHIHSHRVITSIKELPN